MSTHRISQMSRWLIPLKVAALLVFAFLTNRHVDVGGRVDYLLNNYDGYVVLIFGALWITCLSGLLATAFLAPFWLRVLFSLPLLAGTLIGCTFVNIAGTEVLYGNAAIMRQWISFIGPTITFYSGPVTTAVVLTLFGAFTLLTPTGWPIRDGISFVDPPLARAFGRCGYTTNSNRRHDPGAGRVRNDWIANPVHGAESLPARRNQPTTGNGY